MKCHSNQNGELRGFVPFRRESFVAKDFSRVCGKHFPPEAFVRSAGGTVCLSGGAIPSVFPDWPCHLQRSAATPSSSRRQLVRVPSPPSVQVEIGSDCEAELAHDVPLDLPPVGSTEENGEASADNTEPCPPFNPTASVRHDHGFYLRGSYDATYRYVRHLEQELERWKRRTTGICL